MKNKFLSEDVPDQNISSLTSAVIYQAIRTIRRMGNLRWRKGMSIHQRKQKLQEIIEWTNNTHYDIWWLAWETFCDYDAGQSAKRIRAMAERAIVQLERSHY